MNYKKLKEDLLKKVGTLTITALGVNQSNASEKKLLKLAKKYNMKISDY
ncbi:MAG: hypothetical protein ACREVX_02105 [Clostridium sp.]